MMRTRHFFILILSLAVLLSPAFAGTALADDSFTADGVTLSNIILDPASLPGGGEVSVTAKIAVDMSRADGEIQNVKIIGGAVSVSEPLDSVPLGSSSDIAFTLSLTASQLGKPVPLTVVWDGADPGLPFTVTVASSAVTEPQVSFTRTADKTLVESGGTVTFTYTVKNTGTVDISNLVITDEGAGESMKLTEASLAAGSTVSKTYELKVTADVTSTPKLSYSSGGKSYSTACPAKTVQLKVVMLQAVLRAVTPVTIEPGGEVTLVCDLVNAGSVKLSNIVIDEATLGKKLFTAPSLDKESTMQFSKTVELTQTTKFQYFITAKDDTGRVYTNRSNELEITVAEDNGKYSIEIKASPDAMQLAEPGKVSFEITVTNKGSAPVANVDIRNQENEVLTHFDSLPAGVSSFTYEERIEKTTDFDFTLIVNPDTGDYSRSTGPVQIKVAEQPTGTPLASATAAPTPSPTDSASVSGKPAGSLSSVFIAMLVIGVLIAVTIVVLVVMIITDKVRHRRR